MVFPSGHGGELTKTNNGLYAVSSRYFSYTRRTVYLSNALARKIVFTVTRPTQNFLMAKSNTRKYCCEFESRSGPTKFHCPANLQNL